MIVVTVVKVPNLLNADGRRTMFGQQFPHCSVNRTLHLEHQVVRASDKADDRRRGSPSSSKRLRDVKRSVFLSCRRYKLCGVFDELASIVRRPLREASLSLHASFPWLAWLSNVKSRTEQESLSARREAFKMMVMECLGDTSGKNIVFYATLRLGTVAVGPS